MHKLNRDKPQWSELRMRAKHQAVFGKPDFIFPEARLAVFVGGCFWHGCPKHVTRPKNNRVFWRRKLSANKRRGQVVNRTLLKAGSRVLRIWEHELQKCGVQGAEGGTARWRSASAGH